MYVGVSLNVAARLAGHRSYSKWFDDVAAITIENFPNEHDARRAEKDAILNEKPLFNVIYGTNPRSEISILGVHHLADLLNISAGKIRAALQYKYFPLKPIGEKPYKWARAQVEWQLANNQNAINELNRIRGEMHNAA